LLHPRSWPKSTKNPKGTRKQRFEPRLWFNVASPILCRIGKHCSVTRNRTRGQKQHLKRPSAEKLVLSQVTLFLTLRRRKRTS